MVHEETSAEDALGSGPALDETFDFTIANDGDLNSSSGLEELQKDLGFQMAFLLSEFEGQPLTPDVFSDVRSIARRIALSDDRVTSVNDSNFRVEQDENETIKITMTVGTTFEERELVVTL